MLKYKGNWMKIINDHPKLKELPFSMKKINNSFDSRESDFSKTLPKQNNLMYQKFSLKFIDDNIKLLFVKNYNLYFKLILLWSIRENSWELNYK